MNNGIIVPVTFGVACMNGKVMLKDVNVDAGILYDYMVENDMHAYSIICHTMWAAYDMVNVRTGEVRNMFMVNGKIIWAVYTEHMYDDNGNIIDDHIDDVDFSGNETLESFVMHLHDMYVKRMSAHDPYFRNRYSSLDEIVIRDF